MFSTELLNKDLELFDTDEGKLEYVRSKLELERLRFKRMQVVAEKQATKAPTTVWAMIKHLEGLEAKLSEVVRDKKAQQVRICSFRCSQDEHKKLIKLLKVMRSGELEDMVAINNIIRKYE